MGTDEGEEERRGRRGGRVRRERKRGMEREKARGKDTEDLFIFRSLVRQSFPRIQDSHHSLKKSYVAFYSTLN